MKIESQGRVLPPEMMAAFQRRGLDANSLAQLTGLSTRTLRSVEAGGRTTARTRAKLAHVLASQPRLTEEEPTARIMAAADRLAAAMNRLAAALEDHDN